MRVIRRKGESEWNKKTKDEERKMKIVTLFTGVNKWSVSYLRTPDIFV